MIDSKPHIRVSIVEDDQKIRESLVILLEGSPGFRCISAYESAEDAVEDIILKEPDVVLMDINLPGMSGIECVKKIKVFNAKIQVLMLTVYEDTERVFQALEAGAGGYLLKRVPAAELLAGIENLYNGGAPMTGQIARKVVQYFHKFSKQGDGIETLSSRESEILALLAKGFTYKEIGVQLFISAETVHSHLRKVYEKLQVRSRSEAILKYLKK